ncbi:MAG: radical SAM protein [Clostridia bacterium]|nr:radical SAM protein [Clostridia bacterium]
MQNEYLSCSLCPRLCGGDRTQKAGRCGGGARALVAAASLHKWEEPCLSGERGAGTVFFSGCSLGCVFCQNREISIDKKGEEVSDERLAQIFRSLEEAGAECLDLVTATHFAPSVFRALDIAGVGIPVVWNTGGYELSERIPELCRHIDVYLPDIKYFSPELSYELSGAKDYFENAVASLSAAVELIGECEFDNRGIMRRGVIVRHLVLPGCRADSVDILRAVKKEVDISKIRLSLMSQFTPMFPEHLPKKLQRRLTSFEYGAVAREAEALGYNGWCQERSSAKEEYLPSFDLKVLGKPIKDVKL